jgi:phosphopantetheinyl transferase (holo-ACP synthase)
MAEKVEIYPLLRSATDWAAKELSIKSFCLRQIVNWNCEMERL